MVLTPNNREELVRALADASARGVRVETVDLTKINSLIEHKPEDMTATVEAGMTLERFQGHLQSAGQWLPIDPANARGITIGDLLAYNLSGPRRLGYGTIRDYLIGIKVALTNGEIIKAGGKVVKNVAGYDLCKLFVGAKHTLGIVVEGTFKLRPLPEREIILEASFDSIAALNAAVRSLLESSVDPTILDAHNLQGHLQLVTAFAGSQEDVEYQLELARKVARWTESSNAYDTALPQAISVLPSATADHLAKLDKAKFIARFGNGVIHHDGPRRMERALPNSVLAARIKKAYDPSGILPEYTL